MGWNTWDAFGCDVSAAGIKNATDLAVGFGLGDLGYQYVVVDDCWQGMERSNDGNLVANPDTFPDGMADVSDYVHNADPRFKFGIYSSAGTKTCAGRPGSLGHEDKDAALWASWNVDYVKYDNCYQTGESSLSRYTAMSNAIKATGREMFYSLCNWGNENVASWAGTIANSWRTT